MNVRLRPFTSEDRVEALRAQRELAEDGFVFLLAYDPDAPWDDYVRTLEDLAQGRRVPEGLVPAATLVGDVDGELVGRVSVRYELNDFLAARGGHIGYAVRPQFRRRGYATQMLHQAVGILGERGLRSVLVTCDDDNVASAAVIEACGGQLEAVVEIDGDRLRRYWIS